jgi:hypothetical protein
MSFAAGQQLPNNRRLFQDFPSTIKTANRSLSQSSCAALVSVQLVQFWQDPSDGFSRSVRLL